MLRLLNALRECVRSGRLPNLGAAANGTNYPRMRA